MQTPTRFLRPASRGKRTLLKKLQDVKVFYQDSSRRDSMYRILIGFFSVLSASLLWRLIPRVIAQRQQSQLQLEDTNDRLVKTLDEFNKLYHQAPCGYFSLNHDGGIIAINATALNWLGYKHDEVVDKLNFTEIATTDSGKKFKTVFATLKSSGAVKEIEFEIVKKDGKVFPVLFNAVSFKDGFRRSMSRCTIFDITERKQSEEKVKKARDQAIEASKFKSEFLANMSHEIRTPMNGILGMTEMMLRTNLDDRQRGFAMTINEAGQSLLAVINDILDFSKIEAGKLTIEIAEFEPVRLVESVAELLANQARKKKLTLLTYIDPAIPQLMRGDPGRLRQILMNFAGNSMKFSEQGEVVIRASIVGDYGEMLSVRFSVTDSGIGMTPEEQSKLFQPFVQGDGSITRKYGGTGLGLSICKSLVDLLGGEIGVESEKGKGSKFWFIVPLQRAPSVPNAVRLAQDLANMRVLVVDDEDASREILHEYLRSWGMNGNKASNAKEALAMLKQTVKEQPHAVALIDLFMAGTNGIELGQAIRSDNELKDMKLILVTAYDNPGAGEEAITQGFDAYLTKPIKQSQLLDCITTVVSESDRKYVASTAIGAQKKEQVVNVATAALRDELLLVVEDHAINQEVALLLLKDLGFEAHVAQNGRHALELMERCQYSLIFMDCQMPELDGMATTGIIRKSEAHTGRHTPIVAMTAHALEGSREQCLAAGMDDYISKPISPNALTAVLERWLPVEALGKAAKASVKKPIDFAALSKKYGGKNVDRLVQAFLRDAPKQIAEIEAQTKGQDVQKLLSTTHGLKGVSGTVCATAMHQTCADIEAAARAKNFDEFAKLVHNLKLEFEAVNAFAGEHFKL